MRKALCFVNAYSSVINFGEWVNGGEQATVTVGSLTVTAKYSGARGNDLLVAVVAVDEEFDVVTYLAQLKRIGKGLVRSVPLSPMTGLFFPAPVTYPLPLLLQL